MLKLDVLSLLFAVLTPATPAIGPFHSAVDDFGQAYYATLADPTTPIALGPYQTFALPASNVLPAIDGASTLIFVTSNSGRYTLGNPAMFILSSDSEEGFVSDSSWYCKGYGPTAGVYQADWPKIGNAQSLLITALTNEEYKKWPKGVELSPNLSFIWGLVEDIPLEANNLWAAGLEPDYPENPPRNAICIKR